MAGAVGVPPTAAAVEAASPKANSAGEDTTAALGVVVAFALFRVGFLAAVSGLGVATGPIGLGTIGARTGPFGVSKNCC